MTKLPDTKEKVFKAAVELFAEHGYEKTSMRMIAEKCAISKPAVYYYFPDKESLFNGLIEFGMNRAYESLEKIAQSDKTVREKLIDVVMTRFKDIPEIPSIKKFIAEIFTGGLKCKIDMDLKRKFPKHREGLEKIIKEGIDQGIFRPDLNIKQLIYCLVGAMNIHSRNHYIMDQPPTTRKEARALVDTLLRGALKSKNEELIC